MQVAIDHEVASCYFRFMDIKSFADRLQPEQRKAFVKLAGTNLAYFSQIANGHRRASTELARRFVDASQQIFEDEPESWLTLNGIRPDIWTTNEAA